MGGGGKVSVFNQRGQVHVILDVVGWFDDGTVPAEGLFRSVAPVRSGDSSSFNAKNAKEQRRRQQFSI